jgi:hypothetical protein
MGIALGHSGIKAGSHNRWMVKQNVGYVHNGVLLSYKEWNYVICKKMHVTGDHHVKWN